MDALEKRLCYEMEQRHWVHEPAPVAFRKCLKWWNEFKLDHPVLAMLIRVFGRDHYHLR
jgi:hypothetical protein